MYPGRGDLYYRATEMTEALSTIEPNRQERTTFDRNVSENRERLNFYKETLRALNRCGIPFLLGGAYAYECYTGVHRDTKDLDIFMRRSDCDRAMEFLTQEGYRVEMTHHWLAKVFQGEWFIDIIFSSANGICEVDDKWFQYAVSDSNNAFDMTVQLIPVEEMIWSKGFIMEKERFDGGDINHLIRSHGEKHIDWHRLLERFGKEHWRVLYSHIVLFGFVYPEDKTRCVPQWVIQHFSDLMRQEYSMNESSSNNPAPVPDTATNKERISSDNPDDDEEMNLLELRTTQTTQKSLCNGTLVSRSQYLTDVHKWGYIDARLKFLKKDEITAWTRQIPDLHIFDPAVVKKGIETPSPTDT